MINRILELSVIPRRARISSHESRGGRAAAHHLLRAENEAHARRARHIFA